MPSRSSLLALTVLLLGACSRGPAEPDAGPPASSVAAVAPLQWDAPATWTTLDAPRSGPKKASYQVPQTANDKEGATVEVYFYGTGSLGDEDRVFKEWFGQFDGDVGRDAKREPLEAHGLKSDVIDVVGTYKISLAPPRIKKSPVQMVKQHFRLVGAVVKTPDRGNWFFKMVGPDDTVQAARSAFRALLDSAR